MPPIKRALISVSDKSGIVDFARQLLHFDVEIVSTGGTARLLREHGIKVTEVSDYTGSPEIMDGRVKTLHPKIHGGLLGRRGIDDETMRQHSIPAIDLVVVNLYPFEKTIANSDCDLATAIENIDIGGPTMLRAAAKNHHAVTTVVDSNDYAQILSEMEINKGAIPEATRFAFAVKAFEHTARYDSVIANYLGSIKEDGSRQPFANTFSSQLVKVQDLRYGENPHQRAAFYREHTQSGASVATAEQLQGKALSYNNIADTDAALECVKSFATTACVIVKHANPCGVALGVTCLDAYQRAYQTDPTSAFGGIIAFNRPLDKLTAQAIIDQQFVEVIIAPTIEGEALATLAAKKNIRALACGKSEFTTSNELDMKRVTGGLLIQDRDIGMVTRDALNTASHRSPTDQEIDDLLFAWRVAKFVKSNAIVYSKNGVTIGIGAGQMSRVYSARIATIKATDADLTVQGSVMASDAFFPFRDGIDAAAQAGITAIIQPGGSMRDQEIIDAANEHGMAMVFTGMRHFRH